MVTRIFKSGNSLAIRIPASAHIGEAGSEVEITRKNKTLVIHPRKKTLKGIMERFAAFDRGFMADGRDRGPEPERKW